MDTSIVDKVVEQLKALPSELQWRVLGVYTRSIPFCSAWRLWKTTTSALPEQCPLSDVKLMREAIKQGCGTGLTSMKW